MQPCIAVPHTARLVPPELGDEQHEDGVNLQTAQQHAQCQNPFGQRRDMAEVVHRPHAAEPRPHVGNAGQRRRERAHQIHVLHGQDNRTHCSNNKIQQEYLQGRIETLKKYLAINKDEKKADDLFKEEKYKEARNLYEEVMEKYKGLEGDKYFEKENYDILMQEIEEKYKKAKKKASWIPFL